MLHLCGSRPDARSALRSHGAAWLYVVQEGRPGKGQQTTYERKWLQLRFYNTAAAQGRITGNQLGELDINIADYAADEGRAQVNKIVACDENVSAAVGTSSKLLLTVGCAHAAAAAAWRSLATPCLPHESMQLVGGWACQH